MSGSISPNSGGIVVQMNVVNNSSAAVDAQASKPTFDGRKAVIGIVLEDLNSNGPLRQALASR